MFDSLWPTTWWGWGLTIASVALVFLPRRYDPAIRLKEWLDKKGKSR